MDRLKSSLFLLAVLIILAAAASRIVNTIETTTRQAFAPANAMLTEAAQILHPTPTILPDPVTIIREIEALARLETIQYSVEKVITAETNQGTFGFLFGDKLLFVAHGRVIAGVDLAKLTADDIEIDGDTLKIHLPLAEVFVATLDNDKSYVYDRDTGLLTKGQTHLETAARQAAEKEILNAALEDGILHQAQVNAENFLYRLLRDLGYPTVEFLQP
ncbi:MAG: DUF4230 domain-containing protein [Anaerolineae bacterium]|nr:DUF4230 domain-containing protein [Anaerolineae bacterium]